MQAYLIIGNSPNLVQKEVEKINGRLKNKLIKFELQKIADTRELKEFTSLKFNNPTSILIENIDTATEESLNAFLKSLEEPQLNIFYILTAKAISKILPTILSRCQIIKALDTDTFDMRTEDKQSKIFVSSSVGEKFIQIDKIKKRDQAIEFLENLIKYMHKELIDCKNTKSLPQNIEQTNKVLASIKANGNVGLQLTNLVINWL